MSQLVARILLALFVVPLGLIVYFISLFLFESNRRSYSDNSYEITLVATGVITWVFTAAYWMLLWRRQIRWSAQRITGTVLLFPAAAFIACVIGALFNHVERNIGYGFGGVIAPLAWLIGTIILWRETKAERAARITLTSADGVTCPTCGYNLTGLSDARCPECGTKFTLNDLFARQPHREAARLEKEISE